MAERVCAYAVIPSDGLHKRLSAVQGIDDQPLEVIRDGHIAAVVSTVQADRLRPSRAALTAHEKVTALAHRLGPAVPVRFGILFPDKQAVVRDLLAAKREYLEALILDFRGRDEYHLRARYVSDVALREVVSRNRQVQRLRDRVKGGPVTSAANLQLGELVVTGLEALREEDADAVMKHVAPLMVAGQRLPVRGEDTAVHLALLVERERATDLEGAVEELAGKQHGRLQLELIGPLPPWNFTSLEAGAA